ncbi:MAG: CoA-binding protein [Candidatus Hinthialibacter antarcticus]|nr:CoA-binding protein [Candidatus Hinthialibacter antarcticus]
MTAVSIAESFVYLKRLAVVGVSRHQKFGNVIFKELSAKGYDVVPVNPKMESFEGAICYPSLDSITEPVEGVVVVVGKEKVLDVLKDAVKANVRYVWVQQGAGSDETKNYCNQNGLHAVFGQCILMYAKPVGGIHAVHRFVWRMLGLTT